MTAREGRVAGSDTREALATEAVRKAARAAALAAGPGWAAAFGAAGALDRAAGVPHALMPWLTAAMICAAVASAIVAWRWAPDPANRSAGAGQQRLPAGTGTAATVAFGALLILATRDHVVTAVLLLAAPVAAGWIVGGCARTSVAACVGEIRSAAAGVVVAWSLAGLLIAGHLGLVTRGSGAPRAAGWALAYTLGAIVALAGAARSLPKDRRRIALRARWDAGAAPAPETALHALQIEAVTVVFGANTVLQSASLAVDAGELMALVGGNGAGKSTLLKAAAGFVPVRSGRVLIDGDDVTTLQPEERTSAGLAFVSGARPVFPDLTVLDNLRVAAFRTHPTARSFAEAADSVLSLVPAVAARRRVRAGVLSGGEQRLLAVAQTLFRRPAVLFADELSLGLDFEARLAVLDLLRLLAEQGVCVVAVDHDLPSLLPRAHRAALLDRGTIEIFDKPQELLTRRADLLPATFLAGATV